jgi:hypothetical protein
MFVPVRNPPGARAKGSEATAATVMSRQGLVASAACLAVSGTAASETT